MLEIKKKGDASLTRQEMIEKARETRKNVTSAPVEPELLARYPAQVTLRRIPTRVGDSDVYDTTNDQVPPGAPLVINFHGGGFIRARTLNDEVFCRKLVNALGCRVLDVDYRVAPDYPFPAALHEGYDVVKWASAHADELGIDPERIILTGHSAGGNLVCGICMMAHESGDFRVSAAVLDYPPMDLYTDPADKPKMGEGIPFERARLYNLYYCEREMQKDPYVSPYYAGLKMLKDFPKALVITAGQDDLCNEAEAFALKLAQAGNEVTLKRFPGAGHGFTIYRRPGHEQAMELIIRFLKQHIS